MQEPPALSEACLDEELALSFAGGGLSGGSALGLERHLDRCEPCRALVAEAIAALRDSGDLRPQRGTLHTLSAGELVSGRYDIVRFIARGGMGEVYEARDRELNGAPIALKTVASVIADDARAIERLKLEVELARAVSHPGVCRIYDLGVHERRSERIYFITMELLTGTTLGAHLRTHGPLGQLRAVELAQEMAAALAAAHAAGIVHGDFKSDNVMLGVRPLEGEAPRAVVMDFGLSCRVADGSACPANGPGSGTPVYMAPEQLRGAPASVVGDIYALGLVLFEMLTGGVPMIAEKAADMARLRSTVDLPLPSEAVPGIDAHFDDVVAQCLSSEPNRRFRTAAELASALHAAASTALAVTNRGYVEVVPGELNVTILEHALISGSERVPCWSYVTEGLARHGQRELVFTLKRLEGEERAPRDVLGLLQMIHGLAAQGRLVQAGGMTTFGKGTLLGRAAFRGVGYLRAGPIAGVVANSEPLAMVALLAEEVELAQRFGMTRLAARLGKESGHFPYPPWNDRGRSALASADEMQASVLQGAARLALGDASAVCEQNEVVLKRPASAVESLRRGFSQLSAHAGFALLTQLDGSADGCLVWEPGQQSATKITAPGARGRKLSGSFVLCAPQQDQVWGEPFEDGFAFMMTDAACAELRRALCAGAPMRLRGSAGSIGLRLTWYHDRPVRPKAASQLVAHVLDMPDERAGIGAYLDLVDEAVQYHFEAECPRSPAQLLLSFTLGGEREFALELGSEPPLEDALLARLAETLEAIPRPPYPAPLRIECRSALWGAPLPSFRRNP